MEGQGGLTDNDHSILVRWQGGPGPGRLTFVRD
jgi:hypothetical protein